MSDEEMQSTAEQLLGGMAAKQRARARGLGLDAPESVADDGVPVDFGGGNREEVPRRVEHSLPDGVQTLSAEEVERGWDGVELEEGARVLLKGLFPEGPRHG
jgi:hypothetical protein